MRTVVVRRVARADAGAVRALAEAHEGGLLIPELAVLLTPVRLSAGRYLELAGNVRRVIDATAECPVYRDRKAICIYTPRKDRF